MNNLPESFPSKCRMKEDCRDLGFELNGEQAESLMKFADALLSRSEHTNLIGPSEKDRLWKRHFLESVSYLSLIDKKQPVVDIGSGAGFPGLVLAILGLETILLEPRRIRYLFLTRVKEDLGLERTMVIQRRLETVEPELLGTQFIARTVAPPEVLIELIRKKTTTNSKLVYRQPHDTDLVRGGKYIELKCPPLDRPGFLVQYQTSEFT